MAWVIRAVLFHALLLISMVGIDVFVWKEISFYDIPVAEVSCPLSSESRVVRGFSMEPLFFAGDALTISFGWYVCHVPVRNDAVLVSFAGNRVPLLKRIRGIPGDTFQILTLPTGEGEFFLNDEILKNIRGEAYRIPPVRASLWRLYEAEFHGVIPTDKFFVLGEIPTGSLDSSRFGFVSRDDLLGRVEQ